MDWLRMFVGVAIAIFGLWIMMFAGYLMYGEAGSRVDGFGIAALAVGLAIVGAGGFAVLSGAASGKRR